MINHDELIEKTNTILDGVSRLKQEWERSKDTIESVNQIRIVADGYIQSLQEANQSLGQCVDGLIDEVDRIQVVNEEILRTAGAMAKIGKDLG
jgi:hypothetical protein